MRKKKLWITQKNSENANKDGVNAIVKTLPIKNVEFTISAFFIGKERRLFSGQRSVAKGRGSPRVSITLTFWARLDCKEGMVVNCARHVPPTRRPCLSSCPRRPRRVQAWGPQGNLLLRAPHPPAPNSPIKGESARPPPPSVDGCVDVSAVSTRVPPHPPLASMVVPLRVPSVVGAVSDRVTVAIKVAVGVA